MTAEENKALSRRFYEEVLTRGNVDAIDQLAADNFVDHDAAPGLPSNREGAKQWFAMIRTGFPDLRATVNDVLVEGDKVVTRATFEGTHKGPFMGIPATGRTVKLGGIDIVRVSGGKAVEHWGHSDTLTMMQQLGAVSLPERSTE